MALTPEQIAYKVSKESGGRGQIFQLRRNIWKWLQNTPWFTQKYPELTDQVKLVDQIEKIIRQRWAKKAKETRRKNKKRAAKAAEAAKQLKFDL